MLNKLPETINTYTNLSKSTISSLIRDMKVDKIDFATLINKMSTFSTGTDFAAQRITTLAPLNREVLVELFRDSSLKIANFFTAANAVGLALNSMVDILSSEIKKIEKDLDDLQSFIDNYEFLSGKDDLYNSNYIEKFDSYINNYTFDGTDFIIPDKDGVSFDKFGNSFIDPNIGILTMGSSMDQINVINNIKNINIITNYENYSTTNSSFLNLVNDNLKDSWTVTIKSPIVLTSKISDYDTYIKYDQSNINGARTVVELIFENEIEIDTVRFNPNQGNGLQLLQLVIFGPNEQIGSISENINNIANGYSAILNSPKLLNRTTDVSFIKRNVNKIIFIFNQSIYTRTRITPITSELNSKLISSFVEDRIAEKRTKYSLLQDIVYWFFKKKNTVKGVSKNKSTTDTYYSYRFPIDIDNYSKLISDEIFKVSNLNLEDKSLMNTSPIFVDLFFSMMNYMDKDNFEKYSNYYVESNSVKKGQKFIDSPGFILMGNSDNRNDQKYQYYENIRSSGDSKDVVKKLILNESTDSYEYSFSLSSINFCETLNQAIDKSCYVSKKIPVDGQILAVKADIDISKDQVEINDIGLDIKEVISYELSVSNEELPVTEADWKPIMFNSKTSVDSEVVIFNGTDFTYQPRFKAKDGSIVLYKNGLLINPTKYSYNQASNSIKLLDSDLYNTGNIFSIMYDIDTTSTNPYEINLVNNNLYKDTIKRFYDNGNLGESFSKTDSYGRIILSYNPYINQIFVKDAIYSPTVGTIFILNSDVSEYTPIRIKLSDGSFATNITNYSKNSEQVSFYNSDLVLFIQSGKNIIFNKVINTPINVDYEYVPYNLRFRFIMRKNIPGINIPGKANSVLIKMKSLVFDNYYNRLNNIKL